MKDLKIVFADSILPISDHERRIIHDFGCEVTQYHTITPKEILEVAHDADAILTVGENSPGKPSKDWKNAKSSHVTASVMTMWI